MRTFHAQGPDRDAMSDYAAQASGQLEPDFSEIARLAELLGRTGARYSEEAVGPYRRLSFDTPHGRASAVIGPGSIGYREGLLETYCEGWDMAPRGRMTARKAYAEYLHGGWGLK